MENIGRGEYDGRKRVMREEREGKREDWREEEGVLRVYIYKYIYIHICKSIYIRIIRIFSLILFQIIVPITHVFLRM